MMNCKDAHRFTQINTDKKMKYEEITDKIIKVFYKVYVEDIPLG